MKKRNVLRDFKNGWVVGLTDENLLIVESPSGDSGEPQLVNGGGQVLPNQRVHNTSTKQTWAITGLTDGRMIPLPPSVAHLVTHVRRKQAVISAQEAEIIDEERRVGVPTLADLGFDDNPRPL